MDLENPMEIVLHYPLTRGMACLGHRGWVSHGECVSVYDYTLDKAYGEL